MKLVIVGGGWAGCAAAYIGVKQGLQVILLERSDMLLGTGLVGGIMRNNGRFTATEELIALGGGELFQIIDENLKHKNVEFPGHHHADLYDITKVPDAVTQYLIHLGVDIHFYSRVDRITSQEIDGGHHIRMVHTHSSASSPSQSYEADAFIDTTGSCGPSKYCNQQGNGCAMCIMRCPSFGPRQSIASLAHLPEITSRRLNGKLGSMSGSCKLLKESLHPSLVEQLNETGVVIIPLSKEYQRNHLSDKSCQQYAYNAYLENLILLDTGHAKLMTPFYPLELLKQIPGFEHARYEDPYSASIGNSIRFVSCSERDDSLLVKNSNNLFCAGERAGLFVGHTEAIATGMLAGFNAARYCYKEEPLVLPTSLCIGDFIRYGREQLYTLDGPSKRYTFSGSIYFDRMKMLGFYTTNLDEINLRVQGAGLYHIFS